MVVRIYKNEIPIAVKRWDKDGRLIMEEYMNGYKQFWTNHS